MDTSEPREAPACGGACGGGRVDVGAVSLSVLCVVHCLALPVLVATVPVLRAALPGEQLVHGLLLLVALPLSALSLGRGVRRHGRRSVLVLGALGLVLMTIDLALPVPGHALTLPGVSLVALAHVLNLQALRFAR